ncbi:MAG: aminomethyl-transferring glycine dehydrogenase subunit GcvPA [Dehalococcoidia bacterium]|nr:aminomethyl-transferring glycine dehydrogenase subunit GcvPA [Dehalococcoidia bacterium]
MTHPYIPNTDEDRKTILDRLGIESADELFEEIPAAYRDPAIALPPQLSEQELLAELSRLAWENVFPEKPISFLGAGAYRHYSPSVVSHIINRGEFKTAYTPYQPEISQGTLQTAFEFQSMVCELTGMDVANTGVYDGASALAEACLMAAGVTGRSRIALLSTLHPSAQSVVRTYALGRDLAVDVFEPGALALTREHACLAIQNPNFFGYIESVDHLSKAASAAGALLVVSADPISLALLRAPSEYGASIVVGEGQSLGISPSFGGPYVGLFACRQELIRRMPGRIVGRTADSDGRIAYVLTLQTREQHIRREHATSNICTSQQLVALAATVYVTVMGKQGLRRVSELCYHKAHYAAQRIADTPGYSLPLAGTFFHEFVVRCPMPVDRLGEHLREQGITAGLDVSDVIDRGLLVCVTEMNSREEIDRLVDALAEAAP